MLILKCGGHNGALRGAATSNCQRGLNRLDGVAIGDIAMRTKDTRMFGVKDVWVVDKHNYPQWYERTDYVPRQRGTWSVQSDITKNPMNHLTRWRQPSAYEFSFNEKAGWYGDYYHSRFAGDYRRRFSGALDDSFPYFDSVNDPDLNWPPFPGALATRAETECLLRARDMKVNLAQFFAEGRKAVDMINSRAYKLAWSYRLARRGNFRGAFRELGYTPKGGHSTIGKSLSRDYLEVIYGMIPFMTDIYGMKGELDRETVVQPFRFSVRATAKQPFNKTVDAGSRAGSRAIFDILGHQYYRCSLTYEVDNSSYAIASRVGLINPAEVAWEVVPWSFVVDWMVPVGDWLSAMTADAGLRFISGTGSRGVKYTYTGHTEVDGTAHYASGDIRCSGSTHSGGRGIYLQSPIPGLYLKNPLSTTHVVNTVALIRSMKR